MAFSLIRKRWFIVSAIVALLFVAVLVGTPYLIRHAAKSWLLENGGDQVQFRDVDFNPFTARLLLKTLDVRVNDETTLSFESAGLDLAWRPLLNRQIKVQSVQLNGLHLVVDNRDVLTLGGITLPDKADTETPPEDDTEKTSGWLSGIDSLTLTDIQIVYRDKNIESDVVFERVQLSDLAQWEPEQPAHVEAVGSVNGAELVLNVDIAPLARQPLYRGSVSLKELTLARLAALAQPTLERLQGKLSIQSDFDVALSADSMKIKHDGDVAISGLDLAVAAATLNVGSTRLEGKTEISLNKGDVVVANQGSLAVDSIKLISDAANLDNQSVNWSGNTDLQLAGTDKSMTLAAEGELNVGPVSATVQQPDVHIANKRFALKGKLAYAQGADKPAVQLDSDIAIEELAIAIEQRKTPLIDLQAFNVDDLQLEAIDNIRAASIKAQSLVVGRNGDAAAAQKNASALLQIANTTIDKPSFSNNVVAIDSLRQEGMHVRIHRDSEGKLTLMQLIEKIKQLAAAPAPETAADVPQQQSAETSAEKAAADKVAIAINRLHIGGDSVVSILDESVEPAFKTDLLVQSASIEAMDSRKPAQPSPLLVDAKIGKHTGIALKGTVQPFQKTPGIDLQGNISAMDLPPLSSYTRNSIGLLLNSGTLDSELSVKTKADTLDGQIKLDLQQLELTATEAKNNLQSQLPVPLDVALDTLRDKQNRIQLTIPVTGNINDPKFSFNDAVNQALAKALQKGAFSYLKHALQPYGTLISIAQYAGEQASKVRLNPIEFAPGSFELGADDREYLKKVAQMLKDRPKIAIKLCGVAVQRDHPALQQQLQAQQPQPPPAPTGTAQPPQQVVTVDQARFTELAQQRADAVKDHLIDQYGIPASHLVGCLPQLELRSQEAAPRTDLLI